MHKQILIKKENELQWSLYVLNTVISSNDIASIMYRSEMYKMKEPMM